jgi:hypothetical protein
MLIYPTHLRTSVTLRKRDGRLVRIDFFKGLLSIRQLAEVHSSDQPYLFNEMSRLVHWAIGGIK